MRTDRDRLLDVLEAIERIEQYAPLGKEVFDRDRLIQTWVVHHLEIIGEACRALSEDLVRKHADADWKRIIGMRNVLAHRYFEIDVDIVWSVVEHDLPALKDNIQAILKSLGKGP